MQDPQNDRFPGFDIMKSYSTREIVEKTSPDAKRCLIEMVKLQLQVRKKTKNEFNSIQFNLFVSVN